MLDIGLWDKGDTKISVNVCVQVMRLGRSVREWICVQAANPLGSVSVCVLWVGPI